MGQTNCESDPTMRPSASKGGASNPIRILIVGPSLDILGGQAVQADRLLRHGETGYLVASGDDQSMGERIISLLKNPDLGREMGRRGRQIVEEEFSCESQLQKTEDLYDRLLKKNLGLT